MKSSFLLCFFTLFLTGNASTSRIFEQNETEHPTATGIKAYKSAEFGMSFQQVADLPDFKDWMQDTDFPYLVKFDETIDTSKYRVTLYFFQDKLYRVDITSAYDLFKPAEQFAEVEQETAQLKAYLTQQFGKPNTDNGTPRMSATSPGYINLVNKWQNGTIWATLGISESRLGKEYKTIAKIYDLPVYRAAQAAGK